MIDVLVVDDDASLRESLSLALAGSFEVRTAASVEQALGLLEERLPDVLVLDEQLPGLNGTEMLERLQPVGPPTVLMLSGSADVGLARRAMRLGAFDCLAKPFDLAKLAARITAAATQTRRRRLEAPFGLTGLRRMERSLEASKGEPMGDLDQRMRRVQRDLAHQALAHAFGDRNAAARSLGLGQLELDQLLEPASGKA